MHTYLKCVRAEVHPQLVDIMLAILLPLAMICMECNQLVHNCARIVMLFKLALTHNIVLGVLSNV